MAGDKTPAVRGFQFGGGGFGNIASAVNMFRGDIAYTQQLFTMPGRRTDGSMDVSVSLTYQSNVREAALTWNADAPTGALGLGWSMAIPHIDMADDGVFTPELQRFRLWTQGNPAPLIEEPATPWLFDAAYDTARLKPAAADVPKEIADAFTANGLPLGKGAEIAAAGAGWSIDDPANLRQFRVEKRDKASAIHDGGRSFQLSAYQFWKILYYPDYERWAVTDEKGRVNSYGGCHPGGDVDGNAIEWGVCWGTPGVADGKPAWYGASGNASGQLCFARAWHLSSTADIWGDRIRYGYNEFPAGERFLTQPVGTGKGALSYTKACYLTSITDVFGRRVRFSYREKLFGTRDEDPREYYDPHKAVPDDTPNAFQDRYQTKYLSGIAMVSDTGAHLLDLEFIYAPMPGSPVANVTNLAGRLRGDTFKRYLTSIVARTPEGSSLPAFDFTYYLALDTRDGASPGALKSLTAPQGGTARYRYARRMLDICDRSVEVVRPTGMHADAFPSVWFGDDYAVTTWTDTLHGRTALSAYTWQGRWTRWEVAADCTLFAGPNGPLESTLQVLTGNGFFAVCFQRNGGDNGWQSYVFRKDIARPGQWVPANVGVATGGAIATAPGKPTLSSSATHCAFHAGDNFLLAASLDTLKGTTHLDRLYWHWPSGSWKLNSITLPACALATGSTHYLTIDQKSGKTTLNRLDATGAWRAQDGPVLEEFAGTSLDQVHVAMGGSAAAVTYAPVFNPTLLSMRLAIVQWDRDWQPRLALAEAPSIVISPGAPSLNPAPVLIADAMVGLGPLLWRYDGHGWLANDALAGPLGENVERRFAYGADHAIQISVLGNDVDRGQPAFGGPATARVVAYDPNQGWGPKPVEPAGRLNSGSPTENWPTSTRDYLTIGNHFYSRGFASNWLDAVKNATDLASKSVLGALAGQGINSHSMIDEAPQFLAFATNEGRTSAVVATLANGRIQGEAQALSKRRISSPSDIGLRPGSNAGGPGMFVSYPDDPNIANFSDSDRFTLHRYAGDAITGALVHDTVASVTFDDGYGQSWPIAYAADAKLAASDASGKVVKYYATTAYPGTADPSKAPFGSIENRYLNGLAYRPGEGASQAANYYDMLDGLLVSATKRDSTGETVSATENEWAVLVERAARTGPGKTATARLSGGFVTQTATTTIQFGARSRQETSCIPQGLTAPSTGQVSSTSTLSVDQKKVTTLVTDTTVYAVDRDFPGFNALHLLASQALTQSSATANKKTVTTQASASLYAGWTNANGGTVPAVAADYKWLGMDSPDFPFGASFTEMAAPAGWQYNGRVNSRTPFGLAGDLLDAGGVPSTVIRAQGRFPMGAVRGASSQQCAFSNFEPYDTGGKFRADNCGFAPDDAAVGTRSLKLPPGGSLAVSVVPANDGPRYILGWWSKTAAGAEVEGAGWTVAVSIDGGKPVETHVALEDTGGVWRYRTVPIELQAAKSSLALTVTARNGGKSDILIDAVAVTPLCSTMKTLTFQPNSHNVTSMANAGGQVVRYLFDAFDRPIGSVAGDGQLVELRARGLSRHFAANGAFDPNGPNSKITLNPAGAAIVESFAAGDEWQKRWKPDDRKAWTPSGGALNFAPAGAKAGTLTWQGKLGSSASISFDLSHFGGSGAGSSAFTVSAGGITLGWTPDKGFKLTQSGKELQAALRGGKTAVRQWLLLLTPGHVSFFGDGQLIFSVAAKWDGRAGVTLTAPPQALSLRQLCVADRPRLSLTYADAVNRDRQTHRLAGDPQAGTTDVMTSHVVVDGMGRVLAQTRTVPASFGKDRGLPLFAYRPNLVDVAAFVAATADSWRMTGDVAAYYDGKDGRTNDEGYPYIGARYLDAPLGLEVESGLPGKRFAIHDVKSTKASDRATTQTSYVATGKDWPEGAFGETRTIGPTKHVNRTIRDTGGDQVSASNAAADGGTIANQANGYQRFVQGGDTFTLDLPNALLAGPQASPSKYRISAERDALGRLTSRTDSATGRTEIVHTPTGDPRFIQSLDKGYYAYIRYDALRRQTEQGVIAGDWDAAMLRAHAADMRWPPGDLGTPSRVFSYDGDGATPNQIGLLTKVVTMNPQSGYPVEEALDYDATGRIARAVTRVDHRTFTLGYRFNPQGEPIEVHYPEGAPLSLVRYDYDDLGAVRAIGDAEDPAAIARYTYDADGNILTETRPGIVTSLAYGATGLVRSQSVAAPGEAALSFAYAHDDAGNVTARTLSRGGEAAVHTEYRYDAADRLTVAETDGKAGNETVDNYDPNGNIWAATLDGHRTDFRLKPGSDRLDAVTGPDGETHQISYNSGGAMTTVLDWKIGYERALARPFRVRTGDTTAYFAYGTGGRRILKRIGKDVHLQLFGGGTVAAATVASDGITCLVQGPLGLAAIVQPRRRLAPLSDYARTLWALYDTAGNRVADYDYSAFGSVLRADGEGAASIPPIFLGRPLDRESGLYDFDARLYSPMLRRFVATDPKAQFASPYVFVGNNPVNYMDPDGTSVNGWQIATGILAGAAAVVGLVASVLTAGAASGLTIATEAALLSENMTIVGVAIPLGSTVAAGEDTLLGGGWLYVTVQAAQGALTSAGTSGFTYDITTSGDDWSVGDFCKSITAGAVSGFITGGVGGAVASNGAASAFDKMTEALTDALSSRMEAQAALKATKAISFTVEAVTRASIKTVASVIGSDASQLITNAFAGDDLANGLGRASVTGAAFGAAAAVPSEIWGAPYVKAVRKIPAKLPQITVNSFDYLVEKVSGAWSDIS